MFVDIMFTLIGTMKDQAIVEIQLFLSESDSPFTLHFIMSELNPLCKIKK